MYSEAKVLITSSIRHTKTQTMKQKIKVYRERRRRLKEIARARKEGVAPRITNETVAEAREDVLAGARKLTYPLAHSKHRVVLTSTLITLLVLLAFLVYMLLTLYRFKSTSRFTYQVTQVLPFPIARVANDFVPYENYLFELNRYIFYYDKVEGVDFSNPDYKPQLDDQKKKILARVVDLSYVRKIAADKNITVSDEEVDRKINLLKSQNKLGNNDKVFNDTLKDFYNWSPSDFRRSIRNDILASKVLAVIDTDARTKLNTASESLKNGTDFAAVVKQYSDDAATKESGGELKSLIDPNDRAVDTLVVDALAKLKPGQLSEPINTGYGFEILKKLEDKDGKYRVAHIFVAFKELSVALNEQKAVSKATTYIKL